MAESYGFFNAVKQSDGSYDRTYEAKDFANFFATLVSDGVFANPADSLKVNISGNTALTVKAGKAFIQGFWFVMDADKTLSFSITDSMYGKYILVKLKLDRTNRNISIVTDVNSNLSITRNTDVYELLLATLRIPSGSTAFKASNLVDQRGGSSCGYVTGMVENIDVGTMFDNLNSQFVEWFDNMKGQLSEDAATNLQNQIDTINNKTAVVKFTMNKNQFKLNKEAYPSHNIYIFDTGNNKVSYPSGFNNGNCYVKSVMYTRTTGTDSAVTWRNGGEVGLMRYTENFMYKPATVGAVLTTDGLAPFFSIEETNYPSFSQQFYVKVVLEKY